MSIVAIADFINEIKVANKSQSDVNSELTGMITKYEPIFLRELLGSDFATIFITGLASDPVPERWTNLLTPNMYSLKQAIANYIYYWYQRNLERQSVGVGTVKTKAANSENVSADDKVSRAWFEMMCTCWQTIKFLRDNGDVYPEYVVPSWYNAFSWSWINWGWANDVFTSTFFYGWYRNYRLPDIFVPLNRMF